MSVIKNSEWDTVEGVSIHTEVDGPIIANMDNEPNEEWEDNARWIAAASPATVIQLCEDFERLRAALEDVTKNWDCDSDGHKYKTGCRACEATKALAAVKGWSE